MFNSKNIKRFYKIGIRKIRNFLSNDKCKECLIFLFFVLIAFVFWMLQTLDGLFQTEFKIPIRLKNVPKQVILTSDVPENIRVKVEDRGTVLLNYMLGKTFFPVSLDFNDFENNASHLHISTQDLKKRIATQLNVSTKLISIQPDTLDLIYTNGEPKKIPVSLNGDIKAARQYYIDHIDFTPDSVTAYAPSEILDTLTKAYTQPFTLKDVTDTVRHRIELQRFKGVKFVPSHSDIIVYADMYSEKQIEVPIYGLNFPPGKILRTFPSKVNVIFQVGLKHFKEVTANDFLVGVTYENVLQNKEDKLPLSIINSSQHASHIRISPSMVDYLIEQQGNDSILKLKQ